MSIGVVLAMSLAAPGAAARIAVGEWGQAVAQAFAAAACAAAAAHTRGRARVVWALFAAGQALWALTDGAAAIAVMAGVDPPEVSALDAGWLAFYVPMIAATLMLYRRLRPERGWQGLIDGLIGAVAIAAVAWTTLLEPVAADGEGGLVGTLVALLYPVLDLACLAALGWIILRHGSRSPVWLRWVVAAFALQCLAGLAYVVSALHGHDVELAAAAIFMAAAWTWVAAGLARRHAAVRAWAAGLHNAPPAWSQRLPFLLGAAIVAIGALHPRPELRAAAAIAAALMAIRAIEAIGVSRGLLAERDELLVTDPLTGAYNRRFLAVETGRAVERALRGGEPLSAIALDLDRFKQVNDNLGHGIGDVLLSEVARSVASQLRSSDVLCRLGGDEFLVLCPGTGADGATVVAERIRRHVRECTERLVPEIPVTTSVGVASLPDHAGDADSLMRAADEALYAAKDSGRDAVRGYVPAGPAVPEPVPG